MGGLPSGYPVVSLGATRSLVCSLLQWIVVDPRPGPAVSGASGAIEENEETRPLAQARGHTMPQEDPLVFTRGRAGTRSWTMLDLPTTAATPCQPCCRVMPRIYAYANVCECIVACVQRCIFYSLHESSYMVAALHYSRLADPLSRASAKTPSLLHGRT